MENPLVISRKIATDKSDQPTDIWPLCSDKTRISSMIDIYVGSVIIS